ncbi:AAA family ATPase [Paracoccus tibetensis]|uniref:ATP-dependent Zn proteases n=1 Tax=Paracoccus tibetensis TaxID=336292 RepID=A0A1G5HP54_9RHOB|nr:AAA family ATPase [Paracoccus tibetensis]SCY65556.1 ATP-dependent Zn proteases [Paracoccus tibetensis]
MTKPDTGTAAPSRPAWRAYAADILNRAREMEARTDAERATLLEEHDAADEVLPRLPGDAAVSFTSPRDQMMILCLAATIGSEDRLRAELQQGAIIAVIGLPDDLLKDARRLLPLLLPPGWRIARSEHERRRPGAVAVVEPAPTYASYAQEGLTRTLETALTFDVPVVLLLPEGLAAAKALEGAEVPLWPFRRMDREIVAERLALSWPQADPAALREQLPPDDQLAVMPMLPLMLSLRSKSVEEAVRVLRNTTGASAARPRQDDPNAGAAGMDLPEGRTQPGIRLAELAGLGAARDVTLGIVEDLRAWHAGELPWDAVHRGMLVVGLPGCGKTELARAMAREPGIHLESASYAQWQARGHLGDMLKAMRASFAAAADQAPSILFLDELDAFGSRTGGGITQHQSYDTKVITAFLEQLDGIDDRVGVVIVAACNHPGVIDPAVLRAGRFDQRVTLRLPDAEALAIILRQHLGSDLPEADLAMLGQMALGLSGADCAAAVRAARAAARRQKRPLTAEDLRAALAPDHLSLPADMRRRAAIHEAGHAVVMTALGLGRVKALRLGPNGGETRMRWFDSDSTRELLQRRCAGHLAGRAAEILLLGTASGGAGGTEDSDLHQATRLVMQCEINLGLGSMGHLSVGAPPPTTALLSLPPHLRQQMKRDLDKALALALEILRQYRTLLESLARDLEIRGFFLEADLAVALAPVIGKNRGNSLEPHQRDSRQPISFWRKP